MTEPAPILAELLASLRRAAEAHPASAPVRPRSAVQVLLLALIAALSALCTARLERLFLSRAGGTAQERGFVIISLAPVLRYTVPHGRPGPRTARHRGPVPARTLREGRLASWWFRHPGARAMPSRASHPRSPQPARAPPCAHPGPIGRQNPPQRGCASARP